MEKIKVVVRHGHTNIAGEAMVINTTDAIVTIRTDVNMNTTVYGIYDLSKAGNIGNIRFLDCDAKITEITVIDSRPIDAIFTEDEICKMIRFYL